MLRELLMLPRVRCAPGARPLGYARAQVSLWSRANRCRAAWMPHHQATQDFVRQMALRARAGGTLWVFGAGLCDDLPLPELAARFGRVVLADACFLPVTLRRLRAWPNIEARTFDASGLILALSYWRPGQPLPEPDAGVLSGFDPATPDLVLSLSLLSQLPLLLLERLEAGGVALGARQALGRRIVEAHLQGLRRFSCPVGLVSESRRIFRNRAAEEIFTESALYDVTPPVAEREWTWQLAPPGEIDAQTSLDLRVFATADLDRIAR